MQMQIEYKIVKIVEIVVELRVVENSSPQDLKFQIVKTEQRAHQDGPTPHNLPKVRRLWHTE